MLPDPRWDDAMSASKAARYFPLPCRSVELIAHKNDDVEVVKGNLTADGVLSWPNGQVSRDRLCPRQYPDVATYQL